MASGAQEFLVPVWERTMCSVACVVDLVSQSLAVNSGNEVCVCGGPGEVI